MIYHMIFQEIDHEATAGDLAAMAERTARYREVEGIEHVVSGRNLAIAPFDEGYTHATLIVARDEQALRDFLADPRHRASVQANAHLVKRRAILDVEGS
ncbi:MAG TPA: Dabb family protein [Acidimicrobiales bacterium]|nr:Dabb family protein [Acidimicrobiales bacterium]